VGLLVWLYRRGFRVPRRILAYSAVALAALAAFYVSPAGQNLRSRTRWFVEDPWGGARPLLWRDSLRMAADRLVAGHGPETFTAAFPHYESKALARAYPDFSHESPHNIFLDALVSQGIPGLLCLAGLCVLGFRGKDPWLAAGLAAAVVAQQFTVFTLPTALLFYVVVALSVEELPGPPWKARWLGVLAIPLLYLAFRFGAADRSLELAKRAPDVPSADAHYGAYLRRKLPGASADLWYSRAIAEKARDLLQQVQAFQLAGASAERATRTADDPFNAWYSLATVAAARNDAAATESALRHAIDAHPNWFKPHWTLAQLLRLQGRLPEALPEAEIAADLNGGKHPEVAATLAELRAAHHK
jgi:tetratricopeptide (TPR) repeat protein